MLVLAVLIFVLAVASVAPRDVEAFEILVFAVLMFVFAVLILVLAVASELPSDVEALRTAVFVFPLIEVTAVAT
jgi:hypothetical protein